MKKFKFLALAMLISTVGLSASELENTNISKDKMQVQIVELLKTPNFKISTDININIKFTFGLEGEIIVLSVDSRNPDVLNYIRKNINYKKIKNPGVRRERYVLPLKFKRINSKSFRVS